MYYPYICDMEDNTYPLYFFQVIIDTQKRATTTSAGTLIKMSSIFIAQILDF